MSVRHMFMNGEPEKAYPHAGSVRISCVASLTLQRRQSFGPASLEVIFESLGVTAREVG